MLIKNLVKIMFLIMINFTFILILNLIRISKSQGCESGWDIEATRGSML